MIINEIIVSTNRNLLRIEDELVESVTNYREKGDITVTFNNEVRNILSKDTANLLYRFNVIYNNTDIINKYFNEIQTNANKGDDILKLHEFYYLFDILVNEIKAIKINYVIRRMNYLFSSYNILPVKENMIKKEIERYIDLDKKTISQCSLYDSLNKIALVFVLDIAEKFNLSIRKAI